MGVFEDRQEWLMQLMQVPEMTRRVKRLSWDKFSRTCEIYNAL